MRTSRLAIFLFLLWSLTPSFAQTAEDKSGPGPAPQTVEQSIEALFGPDGPNAEEEKVEKKPDSDEPIIYISDTDNGRIIIMQGITGHGFTSIGLPGFGFGRFLRPAQVWVDYDKRLYVADSGNNRVIRVDQRPGKGWTELGGFTNPQGVAVDKEGVYIADTDANKVVLVEEIVKDSPVLETISHPQMKRPTSLWIDFQGSLYICAGEDPPGGKLFKTWKEKDRRRWKMFEGEGLAGSRFRPSSMVTSGPKIQLLDDSGQRLINMQNMAGRRLKENRFRRDRRWRLSRPQGLATDEAGKRFFIADSGNDRILEVLANGTIVGEFMSRKEDPTSVLRNPTSIFVASPAPIPEPEEDEDEEEDK